MTDSTLPALPVATEPAATRNMGRRWLARLSHPFRHALKVDRWPLAWRVQVGRATIDELASLERTRAEAQTQRALEKQLDQLATEYKRLIVNSLTHLGISYSQMDEGKRRFSKVKFHKPAITTPEAIYYQVRTDKLPYHISILDLLTESTSATLSAATKRVVNVNWNKYRPEDGCWIVLELKAGMRGIPRHVDFSDVLKYIQEQKEVKPLTVAIGLAENGKVILGDISDFPHLIVAGATGQGKSIWIKQMLATLILRLDPDRLKIIAVDLKGGVEFGKLDGLRHLLMPVIDDKKLVINVLKLIIKETEQRLKIFKEIGVDNLTQYNQKRYYAKKPLPKLPYWIFLVDELANLMLDDEIKHDAEQLLSDITARARAAGIHCVLATQRPSTDVVKGLIKANVPVRIAFATSSEVDSRVIIDSGGAYGLEPKGRMIYAKSADKLELQGAEITPSMFRSILDGVSSGERKETLERRKRHNYGPEDFYRHALNQYEGRFPVKLIFDDFKAYGVSRDDIQKIVNQYSGGEIEVDGAVYEFRRPVLEGRKESARLILLSPAQQETEDADNGILNENVPTAEEAAPASQRIENPQEIKPPEMPEAQPPTLPGSGTENQSGFSGDDLDNFQAIPVN